MVVSLTPELEDLVREKIESGRYTNETDVVADALKLLGLFVGDLVAKFLFQRHHQLHRVERVRAQILDEFGVGRHLVRIDSQLLHDDVFYSLFNSFFSHGLLRFCLCSVCLSHVPESVKP